MKKFSSNNATIILQDAIQGMASLPDNSFDLAICDPPYGASTKASWNYDGKHKVKGFGGDWKLTSEHWDLLEADHSFSFTLAWLSELKRLVKPTGSIWIHATYHNAGFANVACQLLGLEIINEVAWFKRNAFPNLSKRRLTASHETILWVHTGGDKRKYTFNYDEVKKASFQGDNLKEPDKQLRTVWDIPNNKQKEELLFGSHPTQKPMRVTDRLLLISGIKGGKLIVPFAGSGTEVISGIRYGMEVTGYEINEEYFDLATSRIKYETENKISLVW